MKSRVALAVVLLVGALPALGAGGYYATKANEKAHVLTPGNPPVYVPPIPNAGGTCATPTAITTPPYNDSGTTIGATNTVAALPAGCSTYTTVNGPDVVYTFTTGATSNLTFTVTPTANWDPAIYILSTCGTGTTCVTGTDANIHNVAETLNVTTLAAGTYFFYVDSFYSTGTYAAGPYTLAVTGTLPAELMKFELN